MIGFWDRLTAPPDDVEESTGRRMRLLASLLLFYVALGALGMLIAFAFNRNRLPFKDAPTFEIGAAMVAGGLGGYLFSRNARWFNLVACNFIFINVMGTLLVTAMAPAAAQTFLPYLAFGILMASLLLTFRATLFVMLADIVGIMLLVLLVEDLVVEDVVLSAIFVVYMSILIMVAANVNRSIQADVETLNQSIQQTAAISEAKTHFLATISHELRTPLNAIIGFTEILMMGLMGELPPKAQNTTERIHYNSQRLAGLIDNILDISRAERGKLSIQPDLYYIDTIVENVERVLRQQADTKLLHFNVTLDPELPTHLWGDGARVEQIIINLAGNAIKFTEKGSVQVSISAHQNSCMKIEVADTGIGIPYEATDYIFDSFRQVDDTTRRPQGGAGLGLAIVRELTRQMGGQISLTSEMTVGTTFTVILPIVTAEEVMADD